MGTYDQERVGWEDPYWGHLRDCVGLGRPHDQVDAAGKGEGETTVYPEQDDHRLLQPVSGLSIANSELRDVGEDGSQRYDRGRHEEGLGGMGERSLEGRRVPVKAKGDHRDIEGKENEVGDEEDATDSILAMKFIRHCTKLISLCYNDGIGHVQHTSQDDIR